MNAVAKVLGVGAGVFALNKFGRHLSNPTRATASSSADPRQNVFGTQGFRAAGPFGRSGATLALGASAGSNPIGMLAGGAKGILSYWGARTKDIGASFATPMVVTGAVAGAGVGGIIGTTIGAFSKSKGKLAMGAMGLAVGAVGGAITARKVQLKVVESVNLARKAAYQKPVFGNRARGGGPGYKAWSNRRSMGKPGHLGMDGTMPFAMHKARHRSSVR